MPKQFKHPKIFYDLLSVYKMYYGIHKNLPKIFRVTVGSYIMEELSEGMKIVVMSNIKKNEEDFEQGYKLLKNLRGRVEVLRAYFLIAWEMKFISHGAFAELNEKLEEISKEVVGWHEWFGGSLKTNS